MDRKLPTIEVLTMWHNEAFLAPFFLKHYAFADSIRVIDDVDTSDNTKEIIRGFTKRIPYMVNILI